MPYIKNNNKHKNPSPKLYNNLVSNNNETSEFSEFEFYELEPAEVLDVIYNDSHPSFKSYEDIGKVRVRLLYSQKNLGYKDIKSLPWAKPADANIRGFPLKHEIVIVAYYITREKTIDNAGPDSAPKALYYFTKLNVLNSVNHNAMLDVSLTKTFKNNDIYNKLTKVDLGKKFKENKLIHPLELKEGDITIEGRSGSSIRFGSNEDTGNAEILMRAGQRFDIKAKNLLPIEEDINKDDCSIWMTSDRKIPLQIACDNQKSYKAPTSFDGRQIIINSDRIIFNARKNELIGYSNSNINFSANGTFTVNTNKDTIINSKAIYLGFEAKEKVVLGDTLKGILEEILDAISQITVLTGTGPSSPPQNAVKFSSIKARLAKILSKQNYTL